jgi:hypothetical protein
MAPDRRGTAAGWGPRVAFNHTTLSLGGDFPFPENALAGIGALATRLAAVDM